MVINRELAAYGVFQIAFATLDTRLSRSVVALCRCENTKLTFAIVSSMPFGRRLEILRRAVKTTRADLPNDSDIRELDDACNLAESVQKWRNARIHAEVRFHENEPVLIGPDGRPLVIDGKECEQKIRDAIHAGIGMETAVPHLCAFRQDIEELMGGSPDAGL